VFPSVQIQGSEIPNTHNSNFWKWTGVTTTKFLIRCSQLRNGQFRRRYHWTMWKTISKIMLSATSKPISPIHIVANLPKRHWLSWSSQRALVRRKPLEIVIRRENHWIMTSLQFQAWIQIQRMVINSELLVLAKDSLFIIKVKSWTMMKLWREICLACFSASPSTILKLDPSEWTPKIKPCELKKSIQ